MKKKIAYLMLVVSFLLLIVGARPIKSPVFMGVITAVEEDNKENITRVTVEGYLKGEKIVKDTYILLVVKDTIVMDNKEDEGKSVFKVGDTIYAILDEKMTKSIPPQVFARRVIVSQNN